MRLLLISGANIAAGGGDAVHTLEIAAGLARCGALVTLVLRGRKLLGNQQDLTLIGLPVTGLKTFDLFWWPAMVWVVTFYLVMRRGFDAVYIRDSFYDLPVVILLKLLGRTVLLELNAVAAADLRVRGRADWKAALTGWAQRKACLAADLVLPVTENLARWVAALGLPPERVTVVANGANPYLYRPLERKEALAEAGLDPARQYFCFAGNLAPWQGGMTVLKAFGRLAEINRDAALLVVGDGQERALLEKEVLRAGLRGRVIFTGRKPYWRVPVFMSACLGGIGGGWWADSPALKKRYQQSGSSALKVFSYLACGLPVIVPDIPDLAGIVRQAGCGLVVDPGRVEALEAALRALLESPGHWAEAGLKGRGYVEREAAWEHRAAQVLAAAGRLRGREK